MEEKRKKEETEDDITEENNHMQSETDETRPEAQMEKPTDQKEESGSEEISGQMEIQDYPEILPEENSESVQQESIAPAQMPVKDVEKEMPDEPSGETKETAKSSFAAMNQPEIIEKPFGSRKDYMDSLTAYGMADYMAGEYRRQNLKASLLSNPSDLEKWLLEKVDIKGYPIEDPREV